MRELFRAGTEMSALKKAALVAQLGRNKLKRLNLRAQDQIHVRLYPGSGSNVSRWRCQWCDSYSTSS